MEKEYSLSCFMEGYLGLVELTLKTEEEMVRALGTVPEHSFPNGFIPVKLVEFNAIGPFNSGYCNSESPGNFLVVKYEHPKRGYAIVSHFFGQDLAYERAEVINGGKLRLYKGRWTDFANGVDIEPADKLPISEAHVREINRVQRFLLSDDPSFDASFGGS